MPPAKRSTSSRRKSTARRSTSTRKSSGSSQPAALKRFSKSLDSAQNALTALRKDVSKDVSSGTRDLYTDLEKFVKDARRNSGKLGTALQKDIDRLQKQLKATASGKKTSARRTSRSTAGRSKSRAGARSKSRAQTGSRARSGSRSRSR
jgi:uncharacterized protein YoxC